MWSELHFALDGALAGTSCEVGGVGIESTTSCVRSERCSAELTAQSGGTGGEPFSGESWFVSARRMAALLSPALNQ